MSNGSLATAGHSVIWHDPEGGAPCILFYDVAEALNQALNTTAVAAVLQRVAEPPVPVAFRIGALHCAAVTARAAIQAFIGAVCHHAPIDGAPASISGAVGSLRAALAVIATDGAEAIQDLVAVGALPRDESAPCPWPAAVAVALATAAADRNLPGALDACGHPGALLSMLQLRLVADMHDLAQAVPGRTVLPGSSPAWREACATLDATLRRIGHLLDRLGADAMVDAAAMDAAATALAAGCASVIRRNGRHAVTAPLAS